MFLSDVDSSSALLLKLGESARIKDDLDFPKLLKIGGLNNDIKDFLNKHITFNSDSTCFIHSSFAESVKSLPDEANSIINLKRVNDLRQINKFFFEVNKKLPSNGIFISCVETKRLRRERIFKKYPSGINFIYYVLDFILKRIFPKLSYTRKIYLWLTKGRNRVLSRTETLGRLYAAGFDLVDQKIIGNNLYFVAEKKKEPLFDFEPLYSIIFKMKRIGQHGKIIKVYKMRTMHAYAEFIQQYVYENNRLDNGGKLKDDFRVSTIGRIFRKYWIDELPMIINLIKGDLKMVGVRPLSPHYLSLYTQELIEKRSETKPGLIPPFYADMPQTLDEIMQSEINYLNEYQKRPLLTDVKYFFKALYNILFKKARSK